jgi:hypothetical protein
MGESRTFRWVEEAEAVVCWVIIWYNSDEDRRGHGEELGIEPGP